MKKLLGLLTAAVLVAGISTAASAAATDNAYVLVRCTVTISVQVLTNNSTWWAHGSNPYDTSPGFSYESGASSVSIRNNSLGAITKWSLQISTIQTKAFSNYSDDLTTGWVADSGDGMWVPGATAGIMTAALSAVFKSQPSSETDYDASTILTLSPQVYQTGNSGNNNFRPLGGNGYQSAINPATSAANYVSPSGSDSTDGRGLHFMLKTPTAVLDQNWRRFVIQVSASTN